MRDGKLLRRGLTPHPRTLGQALAASVAILAAGLILHAGLAAGPPPGTPTARVIEVIDGDTLVLEGGAHVRLIGIDTPETMHPEMRGPQPLGPEASRRLRELVEGRRVALEREADGADSDHYGRLLRHVWLGRRLTSEILLREGLAWRLDLPPEGPHEARLDRAAAEARAAGRGLWGLPRPTALPIFSAPEPAAGGHR